jgi:hypothetical protein
MLVRRVFVFNLLCLWSLATLTAQKPVDPTGHWTGTIQTPDLIVDFAVDLARNARGELIGTLDLPAEKIQGLPLTRIALDGTSIVFHARSDQPLTGVLSPDGTTITGDMKAGGAAVPFTMRRIGEARLEAPVPQPPVAVAFEGAWGGILELPHISMRLMLHVANVDGGATARLVNLDQGALEIPASRITQSHYALTLEFKSVSATYAATINADATILTGVFTQGPGSVSVTFSRRP